MRCWRNKSDEDGVLKTLRQKSAEGAGQYKGEIVVTGLGNPVRPDIDGLIARSAA